MIPTIENNEACFVQLWLRLERTQQLLLAQSRRFCIRNVLRSWFGTEATDVFIWKVCNKTVVDDRQAYGWDLLPLPSLYPRKHRELLRAIVAVRLGINLRDVKRQVLEAAYSIAFPNSTPINVNKKKLHYSPDTPSARDENALKTALKCEIRAFFEK